MNTKFSLYFKYFIAFIIGFIFLEIQGWLVYFSAYLTPAFGVSEWTKEHAQLLLFFTNIVTLYIPIVLTGLTIGYIIAKVLKTQATIIIGLTLLPSILLAFSWDGLVSHWYFEIARFLVVVLPLWFSIKKFGTEKTN